jgi:dienelactone hydrolase
VIGRLTMTGRFHRLLAGIGMVGVLAGCTAHVHTPYRPDALLASAEDPAGHIFPYARSPVDYTNHVIEQRPELTYQERRLHLRSYGENGQRDDALEAVYYRSNTAGALPLVIVLPLWGSHNYPPDEMTNTLRFRAKGAAHVLRVVGERYIYDWEAMGDARTESEFIEVMRRMVERDRINVIDVSRWVDWAEGRDEIDATRIGVIGFSRSALIAVPAAANEPRLGAVVSVMGGAHPHRIMATCDGRAEVLREKIMTRLGWTREEYERALAPVYAPIDIANYPGRADPSRILVFDSALDECVPQSAREALWETLGRPERYSLQYSHKTSFYAMTGLGLYWMRRRIYDFLEIALSIDTPEL